MNSPRISEYEDYLDNLSLAGLKQEAAEYTKEGGEKRFGLMILKKIANKLARPSSNTTPLNFSQKYETDRYNSTNQDYESRYTA